MKSTTSQGKPFDPFANTANRNGRPPPRGGAGNESESNRQSYHEGGEVVGKYVLGRVLGAGDFDSRTRLCTNSQTGQEFAVKIYDKGVLASYSWMWAQVRDSVQIMRLLPKHDNLIGMVECFETKSSLYILMQMHSPNRVSRIYNAEMEPISLKVTRDLFAQTVRGILHLHDHNVAHLGLAPDHVMVNDRWEAKIGNMVSCRTIGSGFITDLRGTTRTVAPEVLTGEPYDPRQADAWALGVLLYFMVASGRYPHDGANTTKHILANKIRPLPEGVDPDARDLIHRLLQMNPSRRMRVHEILDHPFFDSDDDDFTDEDGFEYERGETNRDQTGDRSPTSAKGKEGFPSIDEKDHSSSSPRPRRDISDANGSSDLSSVKRRDSSMRRRRQSSTSSGGGHPPPPPLHRSLARTLWSEKEGLAILLPEDLPRVEEAAYLIQHVFRLYMLKKESHWDLQIGRKGNLGQLLRVRREGTCADLNNGGGRLKRRGSRSRIRSAQRGDGDGGGSSEWQRKSFSEGVSRGGKRLPSSPQVGSTPSFIDNFDDELGNDGLRTTRIISHGIPRGTRSDGNFRHGSASSERRSSDSLSDSDDGTRDREEEGSGDDAPMNTANTNSKLRHSAISTLDLSTGHRSMRRRRPPRGSTATNTNSSDPSNSNPSTILQHPLLPSPNTTDEHAFLLGLQQGLLLAQQHQQQQQLTTSYPRAHSTSVTHSLARHGGERTSSGASVGWEANEGSRSTSIEPAGSRRKSGGGGLGQRRVQSVASVGRESPQSHKDEFFNPYDATPERKEGPPLLHKLSLTSQPIPNPAPAASEEGGDLASLTGRQSLNPSAVQQRRLSNTSLSLRRLSASSDDREGESEWGKGAGRAASNVAMIAKSPSNASFFASSTMPPPFNVASSDATPPPPRLFGIAAGASPRPPSLSPAFVESAVAALGKMSSLTGRDYAGTPSPSIHQGGSYSTPFAPTTPMLLGSGARGRQGTNTSPPPSTSLHQIQSSHSPSFNSHMMHAAGGGYGYGGQQQTARPPPQGGHSFRQPTRRCFSARGPIACGNTPFPETPYTFSTKTNLINSINQVSTVKKGEASVGSLRSRTSASGKAAEGEETPAAPSPRGIYLVKKKSTPGRGGEESPTRYQVEEKTPTLPRDREQDRGRAKHKIDEGGLLSARTHLMGAPQGNAPAKTSSSAFTSSPPAVTKDMSPAPPNIGNVSSGRSAQPSSQEGRSTSTSMYMYGREHFDGKAPDGGAGRPRPAVRSSPSTAVQAASNQGPSSPSCSSSAFKRGSLISDVSVRLPAL